MWSGSAVSSTKTSPWHPSKYWRHCTTGAGAGGDAQRSGVGSYAAWHLGNPALDTLGCCLPLLLPPSPLLLLLLLRAPGGSRSS